MGLTYTHTFPNVPQYLAELWIGSAGIATANIQCRVTSKSSSWDWYVNRAGADVHFYIDGVERYSGDLSNWGANGTGLSGVQSSEWINFGNFSVSKNSTVQLIINCSAKPVIYLSSGNKALGYLNSGAYTPNWAAEISFLRPPVIASLYNNNMYNGLSGVSASTTSISIGARLSSAGDAATDWWYALSGKDWVECGNPTTIPNLQPGKVYSAIMRAQNGAGHHEYGWISIRTRYEKPVLELNLHENATNIVLFDWSADKPCQQLRYRYRNITELEEINPNYTWNDGWTSYTTINLSGNPSSGQNVEVTDLELGSQYQFLVSVLSSYDYDSLWSDEILMGVETVQPASLLEPFDYIYGESLNLIRNNPSGLENIVTITATKSGVLVASKSFGESNLKNQGDQPFTIDDITEDKWDELYRLLEGTRDTLDLTIKIGTISGDEIIYNEYSGLLILTGNVRTIRLYTHNTIQKTKGSIIEQSRMVKAVAWVGGKDNKPLRCIIDDEQDIQP